MMMVMVPHPGGKKTHSAPRHTMRGQLPMTKIRSGKNSWGKHFIRIIIVRKKTENNSLEFHVVFTLNLVQSAKNIILYRAKKVKLFGKDSEKNEDNFLRFLIGTFSK